MGVWVKSIIAIGAIALLQMPAVAEQPTFRSETELVSLNVTVSGENDKPVQGLRADQFQIFEDGVAQELKFFSPGELPLDVVVLLDTSASMTGSMALVQEAATRFVRALRTGDRASVMGISNGLRVLQPFTDDMKLTEQAIRKATASGKTPLYSSIYTALKELDKDRRTATEPRRQAIVVLSDGQDTASSFSFEDLLPVIRGYAVPIYTIAPRPPKSAKILRELYGESTEIADFELRKLSTETGGRSFFPVSPVELTGVYGEIATELAHQYSLGYQPSLKARDGAFHRIALQISVPGLKWRTRAGYIAQRDAQPRVGDDER